MTVARVCGAIFALFAVFLIGMSLTSPGFLHNPSGFPVDRQFVAVTLNGEPVIDDRARASPTLEISPASWFRFAISGKAHCNSWGGDISFRPGKALVWGTVYQTAVGCRAQELENRYLQALLGTTRWRRQDGALILENDRDVLLFYLASR